MAKWSKVYSNCNCTQKRQQVQLRLCLPWHNLWTQPELTCELFAGSGGPLVLMTAQQTMVSLGLVARTTSVCVAMTMIMGTVITRLTLPASLAGPKSKPPP